MAFSPRDLLLLSLLPQVCFAALQPRPISTFPTDPHAAPKYDVAFLNHLPIGRSEAAYWAGTGGLRDDSEAKAREGGDGRDAQTEDERGGRAGRRHRSKAQREVDLLAIKRKGQEEGENQRVRGVSPYSAIRQPFAPESGLTSRHRVSSQSAQAYPPNPLEKSFLSGTPALATLLNDMIPSEESRVDGAEASAVIFAHISEGVEYAYDALVYSWSRTQRLLPQGVSLPDKSEHSLRAGTPSDGDAEEIFDPSSSSGFGLVFIDGSDLPPTSLLPTFKILKLPSSHQHIPYPSTPLNTPLPSQSSPADPKANSNPRSENWHSRGEHTLPTTDYLCMTPSIYTQRSEEAVKKANRTDLLKEIEGGAQGPEEKEGEEIDPWDYLRHLEGKCLYHRQGWFTYAYCHGSHVRQFRGVPVQTGQGGTVPLEDMNFDAYNLGLSVATFDKLEIAAVNRAAETDTPVQPNDMDPPPLLPLDQLRMTSVRVNREEERRKMGNTVRSLKQRDQQKKATGVPGLRTKDGAGTPAGAIDRKDKHLSVTWGFGTGCIIAGIRREVEIQFHCRMDGTDEIAYVKEVRTCRYILIIHTPRLCVIPGFHTPSPADLPTHGIKCRQIVPDDRVQYSQTARDWSMKLAAQRRVGNLDIEHHGGVELATVRDQLVQDRVDKLKSTGGRAPTGVAAPAHLYELVDDGPLKMRQTPSKVGAPIPELEPVTVPFEDEDGEIHEITVEFVIGEDEEDGDGFNEWGDEIAKLPKAKRRKLTADQDAGAEEDLEAKKAYIATKREENKARREKMAALARAREEQENKDNRLSAKMENWWKGLTTKAPSDAEERDKDDKEREL